MRLINVEYVKAKDMTDKQRENFSINKEDGIIAIETWEYEKGKISRRAVKVSDKGMVKYILEGEKQNGNV
ncbi:MAG: hypothetical protein ACOC1X_01830 [Promethearchaeota archaeon]